MSERFVPRVTRRHALRLLGVVGGSTLVSACTPAPAVPATPVATKPSDAPTGVATPAQAKAVPSPSAQASAVVASPRPASGPAQGAISEAAWQELVAAATREGTVAVATYPGTAYRKVMDAFELAFPGIKVEHATFQSSSRDFLPRILQERQANLFLWDVVTMPTTEMLIQMRPINALDPVRPALVRADVLDDKAWLDGFDGGFLDKDKKWCYALTQNRNPALWYDADQVNPSDIKSVRDVLDPKWKGKLIGPDPRTRGAGFNPATAMRVKTQDNSLIERLYKGQDVRLVDDARLQVEALVRGRAALHVGAITQTILADFVAEGLGRNVKNVPVADFDYLNSSSSVAWLINKAPHPNAAKVLLNWLLSKEAASLWAPGVGVNSRRSDVPLFDPDLVASPAQQLVKVDGEEMLDELQKTQDLAKRVLN